MYALPRTALQPSIVDVVEKFNADPTGTLDSSAAFQAAIDAIPDMVLVTGIGASPPGRPTKAGAIYIPDGTYLIGTQLVIPETKNVTLYGDSPAGAVLQSTSPNHIIQVRDAGHNQQATTIRSLTLLDGGIEIQSSRRRYGRIENVQIIGAPVSAITFGNGCVEWLLEKVIVSECAAGLITSTTGGNATDLITLRHCQFIRNDGIDCTIDAASILFDNCDFEVKRAGFEPQPYVRLSANTSIAEFRSVRFGGESCGNTYVNVGTTAASTASNNVIFSNCYFSTPTAGGTLQSCIKLYHPPRNWVIRDCVISTLSSATQITLIDEAYPNSTIANSISAGHNYVSLSPQTGNGNIRLFSDSGRGWKVDDRNNALQVGTNGIHPGTNLIPRSNNPNGANWLRTNCTATQTATGPSGIVDAWEVTVTGTGSASVTASALAVPDGPVTFSVWARSSDLIGMRLAIQGPASTGWETGRDHDFFLDDQWKQFSVTSYVRGARSINCAILFGLANETPQTADVIEIAYPQATLGTKVRPNIENGGTAAADIRGTPAWQGQVLGNRVISYGSAAPASGYWVVGDIVYNTAPVAGGTMGWVCTATGTPGTWKTFGAISA